MKIAIIKSTDSIVATGGVKVQGLMWAKGLREIGHSVDLINFWESYDWTVYDVIIVLEFGGMFRVIMKTLSLHNNNIVVAPIIDPYTSKAIFKFFVKYWGFQKHLGLSSRFHDLYLGSKYAKLFLTRSIQETEYLSYSCGIQANRIRLVPLSLRFEPLKEMPSKEKFCFDASRLASPNKNVERLIKAAIKYHFNLVLAGYTTSSDREWLYNLIKSHDNIQYLGIISDSELCNYYKRAKVFALPSLIEGVGMVALEAAAYGCEIVLTNVGAPKEYFQEHAELVNPKSIDEIGKAIIRCLEKEIHQPDLLRFIENNYTIQACSKKLEAAISTINTI